MNYLNFNRALFFCLGFGAGALFMLALTEYKSYKLLDQCAADLYVYECQFIAVATKEPRVVVKAPELIPPPVDFAGK